MEPYCSLTSSDFQDAVVRAGLSDNYTENVVCGRQVQASSDFVELTCDPPVLARYVSVDIPGMARLGLCEVTVATCDFKKEVDGVDLTLVVNPSLLGPTGDSDSVIAVYRGPEEISSNVSFGRQVSTGGASGLPSSSGEIVDSSLGCTVKLLSLPEEGGLDRTGVFYAEATRNGLTTRIQTIILPKDGVHIRPVVRTKTASIGDSVVMEMQKALSSPSEDYRWRRNGGDVIETWNNLLSVSIPNVTKEDEGVYSCFIVDQEVEQLHGIMRLIVRDCPSGRWGPPSCLETCRRCYNGGLCDDESGTCICAPGFSGDNCEEVHGRNVFGKTADQRCSNSIDPHHEACRGHLFCLPDPYGCSCAAGYMGLDCMQECAEGTFGADCKQTCHCASGGTCSKDTGECSNGCEAPNFGSNCQCTTENGVLGLEVTSGGPHQLFVAWQPDPCSSGYEVTTRDDCGNIVSQESITETTYHFITGLKLPLNNRVYIRPLYPGDVKGPEVTFSQTRRPTESPTEVNSTSVTSTSLSFSWSKPPCGSRGGIITGYTYILTGVGPPSTEVVQSVTSEESVTIQGLSPLTEYSFQVAANTNAGAGPYSQAQVKTTLKAPQMDVEPAPDSSAVIGGSVAAAVILILTVITVIIVFYKRRSRRKNQPSGVNGDTSLQQNKAFEADVAYQVPEPTAEPAPYMSLGDGVVTISSAHPIAQNPSPSQDVDDYEVSLSSAEPHAYTYVDADIMKKSSAPQTERKPKPKPPLKPHAANDDTYEVLDSAEYASVDEGKEKSSAPSVARKPMPKPHSIPSVSQPAADEYAQQQFFQHFFSQLSVRADELLEYIRKKEQADQYGFPADFKTLPDGQLGPATVALKPQNKTKNRDADIIVYDHSRVVLEPLPNDPDSDYINACYIDGYLEKDKYIASQGPTESTVGDFWRMVWQMKVDKIIMLTNPVENGEVKCHHYWPDTGFKTYSDIAVSTVEKEDVFLDYTIRVFQINKVFSAESNRLVKQFHFKTWPDTEAPGQPTTVLNFMQVVNAERNKGRTVVHCSNGIGRTGTYIALDSMLDQMRQEGQVDVLGFIYRMRQKRNKMVQTPAQYRFIFEALLAASKEDDTSYEIVGKGAKKAKKQVDAKLTRK
ncbi:uncharacterized protein LOC119725398 [Patiria miniata]|uniref:protein-tyrosine-phosphatase n=1 Tax=Patiria miniata TaxID=46514 RepID=A0A913ZNP0_PATMI|nr:uncharacterized protein LOC119725398 [Patiria miniata]